MLPARWMQLFRADDGLPFHNPVREGLPTIQHPEAIQDQDLVLEEKRLRNEGTDPAGTEQPSQDGYEMDEKNGQIAH
jgi:hypothetical protein